MIKQPEGERLARRTHCAFSTLAITKSIGTNFQLRIFQDAKHIINLYCLIHKGTVPCFNNTSSLISFNLTI